MSPKIRCEGRGLLSKNNLSIILGSNAILLLVALLFIPRLIAQKPSVPFLQ
jgi:hypothetical protein